MSRPDQFYEDGYRGGSELSDDCDIDRMIYPERKPDPEPMVSAWPEGMTYAAFQARRDQEQDAREAADAVRDRQFVITEGNVTGANTGPPRTVK